IKEPRFRVFPRPFAAAVEDFCNLGGNVFLSGAYIGTDILDDTNKIAFAERVLKYRWRTDHASRGGGVYANNTLLFGNDINYSFNTDFNPKIYGAENPDGIEPAKDSGALTVMRYAENNISAGVAWNGENYNTVVIGFPFECIPSVSSRNAFMKRVLNFFENDQDIYQVVAKDGRKKSSVNK
ncbi:MAG: xanthan lyase, partial [Candidatus Marinimicrobia bacterium]|nr:xanthan lyase [Candidatus Neomarinimicrobiota bacterium]